MQIQLPEEFTVAHEKAVIAYLAGQLRGREAWRLSFMAFALLDEAV